MKEVSNEIKKITEIIIANLVVRKIILFGSHAKGNETNDSDVDICILVNTSQRKIDIIRQIRRVMYDYSFKPLDVLIYTPEEFYERAKKIKSIEKKIQDEGITLYG